MDNQGDQVRRTALKWAKVYRTVCEMARDRGYVDDANGLLKDINSEDLMRVCEQNMESLQASAQGMKFPPFAHKLNDNDFFAQHLNVYQLLYVFHCQGKLNVETLKSYDKTIEDQQEAFLEQYPSALIFANIIVLVSGDPENKDTVPKKIQDVVLISNKVFKDEIEAQEKRWVDLKYPPKRGAAPNKPRRADEPKIYCKYELFNIDDLVINITKHQLVPAHIPLDCTEKRVLMDKYNINDAQLPKILSVDPITKYFGLRPKQVFKIERDSETAGKYITYRIVC